MQKATIQLETLTCPSCMQKIENGVKALDGIDKENLPEGWRIVNIFEVSDIVYGFPFNSDLFTNNITNLAYKLHPSTKGEIDKEKATSENILTLATGGHQVKNNIVKNNL